MTDSVFSKRTLADIHEEIRQVYLGDERPWILGFSGGKDSTCMVQLVWNALLDLPKDKLVKNIHVISSDTLVESPQIVDRITTSLDKIEKASEKVRLPISTNLLRPPITNTFWVRILGFGYPAPTSMFRWCTDMLKIANADKFITDKVSEYGEVTVLLGTRKDESITRHQSMNLLEIKNSVLSHHKKFAQTYVYTPLVDFTTDDVSTCCKTRIRGEKRTATCWRCIRMPTQVNAPWLLTAARHPVGAAGSDAGRVQWWTDKSHLTASLRTAKSGWSRWPSCGTS